MNFQLAGQEHEQGLRELLSNTPMPGWIRVTFDTNPDFFQAMSVHGHVNQVLIANENGKVKGMGCRSIKPMMVNGRRMNFGYLSGLRLLTEIRRSGMLARGYAALKKLHEENPVPAYLTTIIESNREAQELLTSSRAGLPQYLDRGRFFSYAVNLRKRRRKYSSGIEIRPGVELGPPAILNFLEQWGSQRQFFPALAADDFNQGCLRGLQLDDFRAALDGRGEIIGLAAVWNQSAFKQNIVQGYAMPVMLLKPAINVGLKLAGFRPLPDSGGQLGSLNVAFNCVKGDDPEIFRALLEQIYEENRNSGSHFLVLGMHERDPLRAALRHFLAFRYTSRCYLVCWDDGLDFVKDLETDRIPYLELATM